MIITLPDTSTHEITKNLLKTQEDYSMATGRVLTLIVVADADDDIEAILAPVREASREHPSRVLVVRGAPESEPARLDAKMLFLGDSGSSETVIMTLHGPMANHPAEIVTPLMLPDTPIVAWWPTTAPANPSEHPIGAMAQRRITNARHNVSGNALLRVSSGYTPGDSDMMWSRITSWRGIVASALDRPPHDEILSAQLIGPADNPSVDIAAGWLADRLGVPVERAPTNDNIEDHFPIRKLTITRASGEVTVETRGTRTIKVCVPGHPEALVAMDPRSDTDCLAEELRYLDADVAYACALRGLGKVVVR